MFLAGCFNPIPRPKRARQFLAREYPHCDVTKKKTKKQIVRDISRPEADTTKLPVDPVSAFEIGTKSPEHTIVRRDTTLGHHMHVSQKYC